MVEILNVESAVKRIKSGATIFSGGFHGVGTPEDIIDEMIKQLPKDLTVVCNDAGPPNRGVGRLIDLKLVKKFICSWCGYNPMVSELWEKSEMELELNPQGTLVERIRAGGFGLGGVLTQTGLRTLVEEKWGERVTLDGKDWLYHTPLHADVAIVEAFRADKSGNLVFRRGQRNFCPVMCYAADMVIASVVNPLEEAGSIDPDEVIVPGIVVDILVPQAGVKE